MQNRSFTWTLMPLFVACVLCNAWKVDYHQQRICAVSGSSVVISCSFYYPYNHRVKTFMWTLIKFRHPKPHFITERNFNKRFKYIGDRQHNCSFKIQQVERKDAGKYVFRFTTYSNEGKWSGRDGPTLKVEDLNISMTNGNATTKEGDSVNLTCSNGCDGDDGNLPSALTWFKNGEPIDEGPALYLNNVSSMNSGNYSCSLKTHTGTTSGVINIDVEYGPKNTSVSVRPSTEVDANTNITLICSSRANPPVEEYTWFKIHHNDRDDIMDVGHQLVFFPGDGGQYLCSATNKHGSQNSSVVTLTIKSYWAIFNRYIFIIAAVAVLLIVITVIIAVARLHKKMTLIPKTDSKEDIQNSDYVNWLNCDNDQSQERNQCDDERTEIIYTSVYFNNNRKSNMEQPMNSHADDDVIYITVCTGTMLNP